jgi:dehydrogenase/reductase SDR family member 7B
VNFAGRVVWITGASSGIGAALARVFAETGARLVLSSRRMDELERVRQTCVRPEEHIVVPLDLTRSESFAAITAELLSRCGQIDILINNGGVSQRALAIDSTPTAERAIMEIDYFGTVALTKAVLPSMMAHRAGHVVVISSVMGYIGTPGRSSYAAAKHALHGYFDSLRLELKTHDIAVTLVCPGYVRTAVSANAFGPTGEKNAGPDASKPRGIPAEKCAKIVLRAVARRRAEVYVGRESVAIYLQRFAPWLLRRLLGRLRFSAQALR